jgi:hypothetical protein
MVIGCQGVSKGTVYGNRLPRGKQVKKGSEPLV